MIDASSQSAAAAEQDPVPRIGVYVCHCGGNISDVVDVDRVVEASRHLDNVVVARQTPAMCSQTGQDLVTEDLRSDRIDRVVIAACTPGLHEHTFRHAITRAGHNPYLYEHVNIREQVSWCSSSEPKGATEKAIRLVAAGVAKVRLAKPLSPIAIQTTRHVTVVGGGIAGLRAASDLARAGMSVALIEKSPYLGGHVAQRRTVYPTEDESRELLQRLWDEINNNSRISIHTQAEIIRASGCVGDFQLTVQRLPRGVDPELPDRQLDAAIDACPVRVPSEHDFGLSQRKAIYRAPPNSHPTRASIDWTHCDRCGKCLEATGGEGITLDAKPEEISIRTGAIIIATGYDLYEPRDGEFGYNEHPEVITLAQLQRMLDPSGPTSGHLRLNGQPVRNICLIHCVGSRQLEGVHEPGPDGRLNEYCSRVCCTATLHTAVELRRRFPSVNVFELYRDIRTYGRDHERYYEDASRERVIFIRYPDEQPPVVTGRDASGNRGLAVTVRDTLTFGEELTIPADMVVLATGMVSRPIRTLIDQLKLSRSADGFLQELHPKLRPVELAVSGIFVAGTCQAPMGISEASASGSAAASKALALLRTGQLELDPFRARVDPERCRGTGQCVDVCQHQQAITLRDIERDGTTYRRAEVNTALCNGCGMCVAACPSGAIQVDGWHLTQFDAMIDAIVADYA